MNERGLLKKFLINLFSVLMVLGVVVCVQSFFRVPFVYTASVCSIVLLVHSLISARNNNVWLEVLFFVVWATLLTLYAPFQSAIIMGGYVGVRLLCELVSLFISHVDKTFGVLVEYVFGSLLLTAMYSLVFGVRWWILCLILVVLFFLQLFVYRRYDVFSDELH